MERCSRVCVLVGIGCFETMICDPSCSFSKLLLATTSPGLIPCHRRVLPSRDARLHRAASAPCCPGSRRQMKPVPLCWMAEDGISVAPCSVFTSSRVFTNWFGNSDAVPVVELGPRLHRSRRGVDLVVERQQLAASRSVFSAADRTRPPAASLPAAAAAEPAPDCPQEW